MPDRGKMLSESIAEDIFNMITVDKRFAPGDKLPNEMELAEELKISRTTLREAIKILSARGVLEIHRGIGTYVKETMNIDGDIDINQLADLKVDAGDMYEMRLIFEPEAAYYAAIRATDRELNKIIEYGNVIEEQIKNGLDRTKSEQEFHKAIAKATHNEFMNKLMPTIYRAIGTGVVLSEKNGPAIEDTLQDHRMIVDFLRRRDGEGARVAMKLHIMHAIQELNLERQ